MHTDTRRTFLRRAGITGLVITIGDSLLPLGQLMPAAAQEDGTIEPAAMLDFLRELELTLVEIYQRASQGGLVTSAGGQALLAQFGGHHQTHADALAGVGARTARPSDKLMDALRDRLDARGDESGVLAFLYDLENGSAATHLYAAGIVEGRPALSSITDILPVEAAHAVAVGDLLGRSADSVMPAFQTEEGRADPAIYAEAAEGEEEE
jgi:hypothetical protein